MENETVLQRDREEWTREKGNKNIKYIVTPNKL